MKEEDKLIRYVVLGLGRSGTTAIHFALKGHPNVSALNDEVKVSFFSQGISAFTQRDDNAREKAGGSLWLFDAITGIDTNEHTLAQGLKCVPADEEQAITLVDSLCKYYPDLKIILLHRKDLTAQFGSMLRAQKTGEWHSWRVNGNTENVSIKISKQQFKKYIARSVKKFGKLLSLRDSHDLFLANYEDILLGNEGPNFEELFDFVGIPKLEASWLGCDKVAPPPGKYIENYDKMKQYYLETAGAEAMI